MPPALRRDRLSDDRDTDNWRGSATSCRGIRRAGLADTKSRGTWSPVTVGRVHQIVRKGDSTGIEGFTQPVLQNVAKVFWLKPNSVGWDRFRFVRHPCTVLYVRRRCKWA